MILSPGSLPSLDTGTSVFLSEDDKDEGGTLLAASLAGGVAVALEPFLTILLLTEAKAGGGGAGPDTLDSVDNILTVWQF